MRARVADLTHEEYLKRAKKRFWKKVQMAGGDACWEWLGCKSEEGYGGFGSRLKLGAAHRFSWYIHFGIIPEDLNVLHQCDNPSCVRPEHLFLGTDRDNVYDCMSKGRRAPQQGSSNANSKLTQEDVDFIRQRYVKGKNHLQRGNAKTLADMFDISDIQVRAIVRGEAWNPES